MTVYTCQHCNATSESRADFPSALTVCKACVRDRPIAWKTLLYLLGKHGGAEYAGALRRKPEKRVKATHRLQNLGNLETRRLAEALRFDSVVFPVWRQGKTDRQVAKGGQCAYSDACSDILEKWIQQQKGDGHLIVHPSDIESCAWHEAALAPWPSPISHTSPSPGAPVVDAWELKAREKGRMCKKLKKELKERDAEIAKLVAMEARQQIALETMKGIIEFMAAKLSDTPTQGSHVEVSWNHR